MNILHYVVEYRHRDTGYWTEEALFKPEYKITKTVSPHHFLFFTWEKTVTKCHNQYEAGDAARIKALKLARTLREKDVRVRVCFRSKGYNWLDTVWINGEFKDC